MEEKDLRICKVCRSDETDGPLFYPCACKGSIRYVHEQCLQTWISHSNTKMCEVCKCQYKFAPFVVPFSTSRLYYLFLNKSVPLFSISQFLLDLSIGSIATTCLMGGLVSLVFLADYLSSLNLTERFLRDNFVDDALVELHRPEEGQRVENAENRVEGEGEVGLNPAQEGEPVQAREEQPVQREDVAEAENGINFDDALFGFLNVVNQRDREDPPENQGIEFVFGLKGPISKLFLCVITVIFFNASLMSLLVLLPTFTGKIFKKYVGEDKLAIANTNWDLEITLVLGYFVIILLVTLYLVVTAAKQRYFGNISSGEKMFVGVLVFIYTATKVGILNFIEIIIFPIFNSYLILLSSQSLFFEIDSNYVKTNTLFCWLVGAAFNATLGLFIRNLRSYIRKDILWMFRNTNDPAESLIKDIIKSSFTNYFILLGKSAIKYAITIFIVVFIPVKIYSVLFPSIFPMTFHHTVLKDEDMGVFDITFLHIFVPLSFRLFQPLTAIASLIKVALKEIGEFVGLSDVLFGPATVNDQVEALPDDIEYPSYGRLRMTAFLLLAWLSLFVGSFFLFPIPRRKLLTEYFFIQVNDLYSLTIGLYIVFGASYLAYKFYNLTGETDQFQQLESLFTMSLKVLLVATVWFIVIPLLLAVVFYEVVYLPLILDPQQTAARMPSNFFAFAVLNLNSWYRLVMVFDYPEGYKQKFQKVHDDGLRVDVKEIFVGIFFPIIQNLLFFICIPYVFNKTLLPYLVSEPELLEIYTPLYFADLVTAITFLRFLKDFIVSLHQYIKDKKYLVGNQLQNADESEADANNENGDNNNNDNNYIENNADNDNANHHNDQYFNHRNDEHSSDDDSDNDMDSDSKSDDFVDQEPLGRFFDETAMQYQRREEI